MATLNMQIDTDRIWSSLQAIPAHDRDIWIKIGMAIKSELGNSGYPLFDDWSSSSSNYDPTAVKNVWKSFRGSGISIASLFHLAQEYGWPPNKPGQISAPQPRSASRTSINTCKYALELWMAASTKDEIVGTHLYAINRGIQWAAGAGRIVVPYGKIIGTNADCVIVPIRVQGIGKVQAVQCINADGHKQTFGRLSGGYLLLGNALDKSLPWYVCEGWASAVSMVFHHQNGNGVCAVSFGKSNLDRVALQIKEDHQPDIVRIYQEPE